jgi:hypothetical protein
MEDRKRSLVPDADEPISRSKRIKDESGAPRMSAENEAQVEVCTCYSSRIVMSGWF